MIIKKEEKKEKEKEEKEEKKEEEKKLAHTGRTERDQPKVVQEVLADLKTFPNIKLYEEKFHFPA